MCTKLSSYIKIYLQSCVDRLQAEDFSQTNESLSHKYTEAMSALQQMLEERQIINNNLQLAQR